jgi:hypothetical protein
MNIGFRFFGATAVSFVLASIYCDIFFAGLFFQVGC